MGSGEKLTERHFGDVWLRIAVGDEDTGVGLGCGVYVLRNRRVVEGGGEKSRRTGAAEGKDGEPTEDVSSFFFSDECGWKEREGWKCGK